MANLFQHVVAACALAMLGPGPFLAAAKAQPEAAVFDYKKTRVTFEKDGTSLQESSASAHVLTEGGVKDLAILKFPYITTTQVLDVDSVRVRKPDGSVISTPDCNIQDLPAEISHTAPMYSDIHEKHVLVKGLGAGDVLEFAFRLRTIHPEFPGHFWFQYTPSETAATRDEVLEVLVPAGTDLKVSSPGWDPKVEVRGAFQAYRWRRETANPEAKAPVRRMESPMPAVQISNFRSWQELGQWFWDLQRTRIALTPQLQAKAAELTRGLDQDEDRIRAIYDFVALKLHYISISFGMGRYQPHSAEDVLENGYGDCKDKHCLLTALLNAAGFEAWPVLIRTGGHLDPDLPSPGAFNHVFTVVPRGKDLLWMDTTLEAAPMGFLFYAERDRQALVLPAGGPGGLRRVPNNPAFMNRMQYLAKGTYQPDGTFTGHAEQTCEGDFDLMIRTFFRTTPAAQWKDSIKANTGMPGSSWDLDDLATSPMEATGQAFRVSFAMKIRNPFGENPFQIIIPPLPRLETWSPPPAAAQVPFALGYPGETRLKVEMELPQGWHPVIPAPATLSSPFADFSVNATLKAATLTVEKVMILKMAEVPAQDLEAFRTFLEEIRKQAVPFQAMAGSGANLSTRLTGVTPSRDAMNPARRGAALLEKGQYPEALAEFRKALETRPENPQAHWGLAMVAARQRHGSEALEEGKKVLLLAPKNEWAIIALGQALLDGRCPQEAMEFTNLALKSLPASPALQVILGQGFIDTGQRALGLERLQAAVTGHPGQATLNGAAYTLAEANMNLDLALGWARQAVQIAESDCADLAALNRQSLEKLSDLSRCWDTLGWVHFRMGDLALGRRFVEASWTLDPVAEVGDHLARIFQAQGQSREAEAQWVLAAARPLADLETIGGHYSALTGHPLPERPGRMNAQGDRTNPTPEELLGKALTFTLPGKIKGSGEYAQFECQFTSKGLASTRFLFGYTDLQADAEKFKNVDFRKLLPDDGPERILLKAIVTRSGSVSSLRLIPLASSLDDPNHSSPESGQAAR